MKTFTARHPLFLAWAAIPGQPLLHVVEAGRSTCGVTVSPREGAKPRKFDENRCCAKCARGGGNVAC